MSVSNDNIFSIDLKAVNVTSTNSYQTLIEVRVITRYSKTLVL